jgi:phage gp29-like protein
MASNKFAATARLLDEHSPFDLLRWFRGKYTSVELRLQSGYYDAHFAEYDTIRDTDLLAALNQRILSVAGCAYTISPGGRTARDRRMADLLRTHLDDFDFPSLCINLLSSLGYGFAAVQVDYEDRPVDRKIRNVVKQVRAIHPDHVRLIRATPIDTPDRTFLDGYELRRLTRTEPYTGEPIPRGRVMVHRYTVPGLVPTPYGSGYCGLLYPYLVGMKQAVLKYALISGENYAMPVPAIEKTPEYDETQDNANALQKIFDNWGADGFVDLPLGVRLHLVEASQAGNNEFFGWLLDYLDRAATKLVLAQTLTTSAGASGSYALGTVQDAIKADGDRAIADMLARSLRSQLFTWLRDRNDPPAAVPKIKFDLRNEAVRHQSAQTDKILAEASGRTLDPDYVENKYNVTLAELPTPEPANADS